MLQATTHVDPPAPDTEVWRSSARGAAWCERDLLAKAAKLRAEGYASVLEADAPVTVLAARQSADHYHGLAAQLEMAAQNWGNVARTFGRALTCPDPLTAHTYAETANRLAAAAGLIAGAVEPS
ncbi:hypothetical protein [Streptomyces sp. NRRL S-350]|uniref:hypothetical protein n=1 Tax=Streptomyces sp. NRRL S-350 TaxID=1463902 RepID=UPI0004C15B73|nr:hypothetical protein [Streptomyces sp. NRRL S-350]